jgi:hypothetical protein
MGGPDFICIGAQRAGTSWLYAVLERHPAFWLPPIKELHFFDDPLLRNGPRYYRFLRMRLVAGLGFRRPLSVWDLRYFLHKRSDAWYCRLFEQGKRRGLLTGELTPSYATLDENAFVRMRSINPSTKIIFIMRDPIMRSWSSVLKSRQKHGTHDVLTPEVAIDHSRREGVISKSSYVETINRLERVFPKDQVFYGFFDEIASQPAAFIDRVLSFLGAETGDIGRILPSSPIGSAASGRKPPLEFERALAVQFLDDVRMLSEKFDGPPRTWRRRYEALLEEDASSTIPADALHSKEGNPERAAKCQT